MIKKNFKNSKNLKTKNFQFQLKVIGFRLLLIMNKNKIL